MRSGLISLLAGLLLTGCAIVPNQSEVTGLSANKIVRMVRCETRDAVVHMLGTYLATLKAEPAAVEIGRRLLAGETVAPKDFGRLSAATRGLLGRYARSAVAYDFTFDGTEVNGLSGNLSIVDTFRRGNRSALLNGGVDRTRQNIQTFTVSDTFDGLLRDLTPRYCEVRSEVANQLYPIAGKLGIRDLLYDFVEIAEFSNLGGVAHKGAPTMTSTMSFTTSLTFGATAALAATPVVNLVRIGGGVSPSLKRTDVHKLIIAFSKPVESGLDVDTISILGGRLVSSGGTIEERRARLAIEQTINRFELTPRNTTIINEGILPF